MGRTDMASVPPMGWNSWNTFYDSYDANMIMEVADAMVDKGYLKAGYQYLILDDCWAQADRDDNGDLVPDPEKFPDGIEPVISYIHDRGLKFGIYSSCGVRTCVGRPGSFEHEYQDAARFAEWGVDFLKYDNCHRPNGIPSAPLYRRMSMALRNSGREILLAACQWGTENVSEWIRSTGAHTYRSTVDIQDRWESIKSITDQRLSCLSDGAAGCFNDMDMLVCGMYGRGSNPETSKGGCTEDEYQTHFALWAMLNSPLIIGCDVRSADYRTKSLLQNRDLIAINQDPECRSCFTLKCECDPEGIALVRPLSGGEYAVGMFNFADTEMKMGVTFWDMGLSSESGKQIKCHDCLKQEDIGVLKDCYVDRLPAHGCKVIRCSLTE